MQNIKIDTDMMKSYASRIEKVNNRLAALDIRLKKLYLTCNVIDLYNAGKADGQIGWSLRLQQCQNYLNVTANDFENKEKYLAKQNSISFNKKYKKQSPFDSWIDRNRRILSLYVDKMEPIFYDYFNTGSKTALFGGLYTWFVNDVYGDFKDMIELGEDVMHEQFGIDSSIDGDLIESSTKEDEDLTDSPVKDFFDGLKDLQFIVDVANEFADWQNGKQDFDEFLKESVYGVVSKISKEAIKYSEKISNFKPVGIEKAVHKILLDTLIKMPENWIDGIYDYAKKGEGTAGTVVFDTTVGSFKDAIVSFASPTYKKTTAVSYGLLDQICENFGYDLSQNYEDLSGGEEGLKAVWKVQEELWNDIVYEGIKDKVSNGLDAFYKTSGDIINDWGKGASYLWNSCFKKG